MEGGYDSIREWLQSQKRAFSEKLANHSATANTSHGRTIREWLDGRLTSITNRYQSEKRRFDEIKVILGLDRVKRGLFDAGGSALKWLFGTATEADTRELHNTLAKMQEKEKGMLSVLKHQATILGDTVWLLNSTRQGLELLKTRYQQVTTHLIQTSEATHLLYSFVSGTLACDLADEELDLLLQTTIDLEIGLAALAAGKLPPQLFSPVQLKKVIRAVTTALPAGWRLAMTEKKELNVWDIYREARVVTATMKGQLILFIELPVVEEATQFTLYRIHSLPEFTENGTAVQVVGLPAYLAVMEQQDHYIDRFLELSIADAADCSKSRHQVCHLHSPIGRGEKSKSCALGLFTLDPDGQDLCRKELVSVKSASVIYVGLGTWAVSNIIGPIIVKCGSDPAQTIQVSREPALLVLPPGCSGKTREWVLPAAFRGKSVEDSKEVIWKKTGLPLWSPEPGWTGAKSSAETLAFEASGKPHPRDLSLQLDLVKEVEQLELPADLSSDTGGNLIATAGLVVALCCLVLLVGTVGHLHQRLARLEGGMNGRPGAARSGNGGAPHPPTRPDPAAREDPTAEDEENPEPAPRIRVERVRRESRSPSKYSPNN